MFDDLELGSLTALATRDVFVTADGAGKHDGSSWDDAYSLPDLADVYIDPDDGLFSLAVGVGVDTLTVIEALHTPARVVN